MRSSLNTANLLAENDDIYENDSAYNANIIAEQKKEAHAREMASRYFLRAQLANKFVDVDSFVNMYENGFLDGADWLHTIIRLAGIVAGIEATGINSADTTPENPSSYDKHVGFGTFLPIFLGVVALLPAAIGAYIIYRKIKENRTLSTAEYQMFKIYELNQQTSITQPTALLHKMNDFLARGKVIVKEPIHTPVLAPIPSVPGKPDISSNDDEESSEHDSMPFWYTNSDDLWDEFKISGKAALYSVKIALKPLGKRIKELTKNTQKAALWCYDKLRVLAFNFWPIWFMSVLIVGIGATTAFPATLPIVIVMSVTLAVSALYLGVVAYKRKQKANHEKIQAQYISNELVDSLNDAGNALRQRVFMKEAHTRFKSLFSVPPKAPKDVEHAIPAYKVKTTEKYGIIYFEKNPNALAPRPKVLLSAAEAHISAEDLRAKKKALRQNALYKQMLGKSSTNALRALLNGLFRFMSQYALASFVLWFIGSFAAALAYIVIGPIAAAASAVAFLFVYGPTSLVINFGIGTFAGIASHFSLVKNAKVERDNEKKAIQERLLEPYLGNVVIPKNPNPRKFEVYDHLAKQIETKKLALKARLKAHKQQIFKNELKGDRLTAQEIYLLNLDLDDFRPNNPQYLLAGDKDTETKNLWMRIGRYFYRIVGAMETNAFFWRTTLLVGGVFAGVAPIPGAIFLAIVGVSMLLIAIAKGIQLHLNDKKEDNKRFLKELDEIISGDKKLNKQLDELTEYLNAEEAYAKKNPRHSIKPKKAAKAKAKPVAPTKAASDRLLTDVTSEVPSGRTVTVAPGSTATQGMFSLASLSEFNTSSSARNDMRVSPAGP